jgi:hypothetical protein
LDFGGDLLVESEQPNAVDNLVLHLIFAVGGVQRAVQVADETLNTVELVELESVVVDAEQHLQAAAQRVFVRILKKAECVFFY